MDKVIIECDSGKISDGYHTFDELYEHRILLFIALMKCNKNISWIARKHADGSMYEGWFIGGIRLPSGVITYHIKEIYWESVYKHIPLFETAPEWDGHTGKDVVDRLKQYIAE